MMSNLAFEPYYEYNQAPHLTPAAMSKQLYIKAFQNISQATQPTPLWEKTMLTVDETAELTGIGTGKIRALTSAENCPFVLWNGTKRLIKREPFVKYLLESYSI